MFRYEKRETTKMQPRLYEVTRAIKEQTRRSSGAPLFRTMSATLLCRAKGLHLKEVLDANWPNDHNLAVIAKAATAPATTGTVGWGSNRGCADADRGGNQKILMPRSSDRVPSRILLQNAKLKWPENPA